MNAKQRRTLARVYMQPAPVDIPWSDIIGLFRALGATITQGRGSRIRVKLNGERGHFHDPHPERQTPPERVRDVADFLKRAGVTV